MDIEVKEPKVISRLEGLGFKKASSKIKELSDRKRKMTIAYAAYPHVTTEKVNAFNHKLREKTHNWDKVGGYHVLEFVGVEVYEGAPPEEVLTSMEKAVALEVAEGVKVFDSYEIGYIKKVNDPLLFGRIKGCPDRFYIAQWDSDISITDILSAKEM